MHAEISESAQFLGKLICSVIAKRWIYLDPGDIRKVLGHILLSLGVQMIATSVIILVEHNFIVVLHSVGTL